MGFVIGFIAYVLAAVVAGVVTKSINSDWFSYDTNQHLAIFGVAVALINTFIKPVVKLISLPITCLTLGLFSFVISALMFGLGAKMVDGIDCTWQGALIGSIVLGLVGGLLFSVLDD